MNDIDDNAVAPARPSATIVVLRSASPRPEMLLIKRRAGDAYGETYAFPGGVVDRGEAEAHQFCEGVSPEGANAVLNLADGGLDYYSACIRELFEETGVLIASDGTGRWARTDALPPELRLKVDKGQMSWPDFLTQQKLHLNCDSLHYFAHWETPFSAPKRWTTRFFAAELPPGQDACHDGSETTDSCWLSATQALERRAAGQMDMPYPTVKTLEKLRNFKSIRELIGWTREQRKSGIQMIRPDRKPIPGQF